MKKLILSIFLLACWAASPSAAEIMTYQGRLKDGPLPANGSYSFSFDFCSDGTGSGAGCQSAGPAQSFSVANGLFRSTFTLPAVNLSAGPWYLRVTVNSSPLIPLERLTFVPYSVFSSSAGYAYSASTLTALSGPAVFASTHVVVRGELTAADWTVDPSTYAVVQGAALLKDLTPGTQDVRVGVSGHVISATSDSSDIMAGGNFEAEIPSGKNGIMIGVRAGINNSGSSPQATALFIDGVNNTGTIADTYGVYISTLYSGTQPNKPFAIYSIDRAARTYIAGNVGISSVPAYALVVSSASGDVMWVSSYAVHGQKFVGDGSGLTGVTGATGTDNTKVFKTGDTMTGQLTVAGSTLTVIAPGSLSNSGVLWAGTSTVVPMLFVSTKGYVGVGTSSPMYPLHVIERSGQVAVLIEGYDSSYDSLYIDSKGTGNPLIGLEKAGLLKSSMYVDASDNYVLAMSGAGKMTVTQSGNVGVGTSAPVYQLHVNGGLFAVSSVTTQGFVNAGSYQINGSTVLRVLPGSSSLAVGDRAGLSDAGNYNIFVGSAAGKGHGSGDNNTMLGYGAGFSNTVGSGNTFLGSTAGMNNTTGGNNIVIGALQNTSAPNSSNEINIGGLLFGRMDTAGIGVSTRNPQAALDVVSTGAVSNVYAQIWRDSTGNIISSMSASGAFEAVRFVGDGSGLTGVTGATGTDSTKVLKAGDTMTGPLTMAGSTLTVTGNAFSVGGGTLAVINGRVGIGTSSPASAFHVLVTDNSNLNFANYGGNLVFNTVPQAFAKTIFNNNATGKISFMVDSNEILVVSTPTRVGIGTDVPLYRLHVSSGAGESGTMMAVSTGTTDLFWVAGDGAHAVKFVGDGSGLTGVTGATGTDATKVLKAGDTMTGQLTLAGSTLTVTGGAFSVGGSTLAVYSGKVGIGTVLPSVELHVKNTYGRAFLESAAGNTAWLGLGQNANAYWMLTNNPTGGNWLSFNNLGNTPQLVIQQAGNVGIGDTSPMARLHVEETSALAQYALIVSTNADAASYRLAVSTSGSLGVRAFPPAAALDVAAEGSGASDYVQLWRNSAGVIIASVTDNGTLYGNGSGLTGISASGLTSAGDILVNSTGGNTRIQTGGTDIATFLPAGTLQVNTANTAGAVKEALRLGNPGAGNTTGASLTFYNNGPTWEQAGIAGFYDNPTNSNTLAFYTGNGHTERMRITGSGFVGIATGTPQGLFQVGGGTFTVLSSGTVGIGTEAPVARLDIYAPNTVSYMEIHNASNLNRKVARISQFANNGLLDVFDINEGVVVRLNADKTSPSYINAGYLGIGTTAPKARLDVQETDTVNMNYSLRASTSDTSYHLVVTTGGWVGINQKAPHSTLHIVGDSKNAGVMMEQSAEISDSAFLALSKSRGAPGAEAMVLAGDHLGLLGFAGYNGNSGDPYPLAAALLASVDGAPSAVSMPARLDFMTAPAGTLTPLTRMTINAKGDVGISTGTPAARLDVLAAGSTLLDYAQIWRDSAGVVKASVTATGVFYGDGSGLQNVTASGNVLKSGDTMSGQLTLYNSTLTVGGNVFSVGGSTLVVNAGRVGVNWTSPEAALEVNGGAKFLLGAGTSYILTAGSALRPDMFFVSSGGLVGIGDFTAAKADTSTVLQLEPRLHDYAAGAEDYALGVSVNARAVSGGLQDVLAAGNFEATVEGPASAAMAIGLRAKIRREIAGVGVVGRAMGVFVDQLQNDTGGGITNTYGIYIATQTGGAQTNRPYSIYAEDTNAYNYFGGYVGISSAVPVAALVISSAPGSSGPMLLVSTGASVVFGVKGNGEVYASGRFIGDGSGLINVTGTDATKVLKAGDAMTGPLSINSDVATKSADLLTTGIIISTGGAMQTTGIGHGTVAGSARGTGAVDLQTSRLAAGQAATGDYSVIGGGIGNTASGYASVVSGGQQNSAGASNSYATVGGGVGNSASATYATVGGGTSNKASGFFSVVAGGQSNTVYAANSAAAGGFNNVVSSSNSFSGGGYYNVVAGTSSAVAGGEHNAVYDFYGFIGSGVSNVIASSYSVVAGGASNMTYGVYSAVGGGFSNTANSGYNTIAGGAGNTVNNQYGAIGGGMNNAAGEYGFVGGGYGNQASNVHAAVAGGWNNIAGGMDAFVGGGQGNQTTSNYSVIAGGVSNFMSATDPYAVIGGGYGNNITGSGLYAVIGGGSKNQANMPYSAVLSGSTNTAMGQYSVVAGGWWNTAGAWGTTIGGGIFNNVNVGSYATIAGGSTNTASGFGSFIGAGELNQASGNYAVIPGGYMNAANGTYSFSAGYKSTAAASGSFSWADGTGTGIVNSGMNQVMFKAAGGFWVSTSTLYYTTGLYVSTSNTVNIGTVDSTRADLSLWINKGSGMNTFLLGNDTTKGLKIRDTGTLIDLDSQGVDLMFNSSGKNAYFYQGKVGVGVTTALAGSKMAINEPSPNLTDPYVLKVGTGTSPEMLTVSTTGVVSMPRQSMARAYAPAAGSYVSAAWSWVTMSASYEDNLLEYDTLNSYFTSKYGGLYMVSAHVTFAASTMGTVRGIGLGLNGAVPNPEARDVRRAVSSATDADDMNLTRIMRIPPGQFVRLFVYQDTGANLGVATATMDVVKLN